MSKKKGKYTVNESIEDIVFIRKEKSRVVTPPVGTLLKKKPTKGEIGIEIEVEGNVFRKGNCPEPWVYHHDGSLRGSDNAEYVLQYPVLFSEVSTVIDRLWAMFAFDKSVLDESNRTSVHVHLNVQNFHLNRLAAFAGMYFAVEAILTVWCGDHRVGNLFCLRAKDAPHIVTQLKRFIQQDNFTKVSDGIHYAGFNIQALDKFGSIEIRSLRGVIDPTLILTWVRVLERMYKMSADYPDPRGMVEYFSSVGPIAFLQNILGPDYYTIRNDIDVTEPDIISLMYEGIRIAQDICYCRDWEEFKSIDIKTDPFNRDSLKMAAKLSGEPFVVQPAQPGDFEVGEEDDEDYHDEEEPEPNTW